MAVQLSSQTLISINDYLDQHNIPNKVVWSDSIRITDYDKFDIIINYKPYAKLFTMDIAKDFEIKDLHRKPVIDCLTKINFERYNSFLYISPGSSFLTLKTFRCLDNIHLTEDQIKDIIERDFRNYEMYVEDVSALIGCLEVFDQGKKKVAKTH